eukprot:3111225-Prorocentrum_lima.AAC.1
MPILRTPPQSSILQQPTKAFVQQQMAQQEAGTAAADAFGSAAAEPLPLSLIHISEPTRLDVI